MPRQRRTDGKHVLRGPGLHLADTAQPGVSYGRADVGSAPLERGADNVAVARYRIHRDGQVIAELGSSARSYTDADAIVGSAVYSVVAFDAAGNASRPAKKTVSR